MGLHQCFCHDGVTVPCMCIREGDHDEALFDVPNGEEVVYTLEDSEDQLVDYDEVDATPLDEEEDAPEGKGLTTT